MAQKVLEIQGTEREFQKVFQDLCGNWGPWQVWSDLMGAIACGISNSTETDEARRKAREDEYMQCVGRIGDPEAVAKIATIITLALENNPNQDFLGQLYMSLGLGNSQGGQFFTPYNVCEAMAEMTVPVEQDPTKYITLNDPACGGGATLIAAANILRERGTNYQERALFAAQDISRVTAQMCYIQLSLLGCAGYVIVGDSLMDPVTGSGLEPVEKASQEYWYTPMYFSSVWTMRKILHRGI